MGIGLEMCQGFFAGKSKHKCHLGAPDLPSELLLKQNLHVVFIIYD
jgi:hypothetical protein